jgi:hypothetical protein
MGLTQFLRKLNQNTLHCSTCKEQDIEKRSKQSTFMQDNWNKVHDGITFKTIHPKPIEAPRERYDRTWNEFKELDTDEQDAYFSYHLRIDEFERIRPHWVSLSNGRIQGDAIKRLEYWPVWPSSNQEKYTCVLYDSSRDVIERVNQPQFRCEQCSDVFTVKNFHSLKNQYKVFCKDCKFCRNIFKKRSVPTISGTHVIVQSNLEKKFVDWCNQSSIALKNGPVIQYEWDRKVHKYHVDFELPDLSILIEIKDDHVWHKTQLQTGKWQAKESAAQKEVQSGKYRKFVMMTPRNWIKVRNMIEFLQKTYIRDSLTSRETGEKPNT